MDQVRKKISSFIRDNFLFEKGRIKEDQDLFKSGLVDSFGFVELLSFIEKEFGVNFNRADIEIEKFNTVAKIAKSVKEAQAKK
ncbi:MAG: acyl carrier protein [Candidatus Omnitrophica bacterium]|nr:acyl carrier protein [Candidatus Omnitrophota bacterium]